MLPPVTDTIPIPENVAEPESAIVNETFVTIVTSTLNAGSTLEYLIHSLRDQSARNFDWIVADGGSTDQTLKLLTESSDVLTQLLDGPDFGIYHGLNRAVSVVRTPYYLVIGADDTLDRDAVHHFNAAAAESNADFISGRVRTSDGGELRPARGNPYRYGHLAYVSQHSVGTLIRKNLHDRVGLYSNKFPVAADRHFILKAIERHGATVEALNIIVGTYAMTGTSNAQFYNTLLDIFKVDYELANRPLATALKSLARYAINLRQMSGR